MVSGFGPEHMMNGGTETGENKGDAGFVGGLEINSSILTTLGL